MFHVMIHPADYTNVREAIDRVFERFPMDVKGKKVLIKPNVLRASGPQEGIVTHPTVLRAVVDRMEAMAPASLVVGDNPGLFNYGDNEESFRQTGLMDAAKGHYQNIGNASETVEFNPDVMEKVNVSRAVLDADIIISVPKFKTHGLTVITGAIKNSYGILPGAQKAQLHKAAGSPERFHEVIVEVFGLRVPDLFIMDAVVGMEGNGPASPELRDIGLILASDNAVALDAVMARMMGLDPGRLRFLEKADDMGLGSYDSAQIKIEGAFHAIPDFKVPPLGGEAIMDNPAIQDMIHQKTLLTPQVDPDLCTACETCVAHCPASALSMVDQLPHVDMERCVTCFCCQEMCPEKAMALR